VITIVFDVDIYNGCDRHNKIPHCRGSDEEMRSIVLQACAIIAALLSASSAQGQTVSVTGHVIDAATHEPVPSVTVLVRETGERTRTDSAGIFHVALRSTGRYTVALHHVAFAGVERTIVLSSLPDDTLVVAMQPAIIRGDEVVVQSTRIATEEDNTPYAIDVALSDRLIQQAYVTVADALSEIPGVSLVRDGTWETTVSIRGMSRSNIVTMNVWNWSSRRDPCCTEAVRSGASCISSRSARRLRNSSGRMRKLPAMSRAWIGVRGSIWRSRIHRTGMR
jgi:hypothetical protein